MLTDKTWVGVVPFACSAWPKPGWPSDPNSGGDLVGCHSGPDIHDHPQVIIHAPNHPFGHTDEMYGRARRRLQRALRRRLGAVHQADDLPVDLGGPLDAQPG